MGYTCCTLSLSIYVTTILPAAISCGKRWRIRRHTAFPPSTRTRQSTDKFTIILLMIRLILDGMSRNSSSTAVWVECSVHGRWAPFRTMNSSNVSPLGTLDRAIDWQCLHSSQMVSWVTGQDIVPVHASNLLFMAPFPSGCSMWVSFAFLAKVWRGGFRFKATKTKQITQTDT